MKRLIGTMLAAASLTLVGCATENAHPEVGRTQAVDFETADGEPVYSEQTPVAVRDSGSDEKPNAAQVALGLIAAGAGGFASHPLGPQQYQPQACIGVPPYCPYPSAAQCLCNAYGLCHWGCVQ